MPSALIAIAAQGSTCNLDTELWREVPGLVRHYFSQALPMAAKQAAQATTGPVWAVDLPGFPCAVLVKRAAAPLKPLADAVAAVQRPLGGPHPLALTIAGGLLGSGLGYGAGMLGEKILGEDTVEPGRLRRTGALLGAGLGTLPGVGWWAGTSSHGTPLKNWTTNPFTGQDPPPQVETGRPLPSPMPAQQGPPLPADVKLAFESMTGALYTPSIPVDAFNNVIWSDVIQGQNPYGYKDYRGSNEQPLTTPPWAAAAASGIISGASEATRSPAVSPWHVGLTAAASAGKGYVAGLTFGKLMGALAGLQPEAQDNLKRIGLWGGLVSGAVNALFH